MAIGPSVDKSANSPYGTRWPPLWPWLLHHLGGLYPEGFYETLYHEMGHATGHASRLNRKELNRVSAFGSHDYSLEELVAELVAELAAAFLSAEAGIDQAVIQNQAAYLQGWMEKLQKESTAFVTAAARAQKSADFILGRRPEEKNTEEAA